MTGLTADTRGEEVPALVAARDITVRFGGITALSEVSLELRRGASRVSSDRMVPESRRCSECFRGSCDQTVGECGC